MTESVKFPEGKIALVLGTGAARGLAHIGVLKVLEANGISVDMVIGTSMGALIGGAYAAGLSAAQIEEIAAGTNWLQVARILFPRRLQRKALLDGERFQEFLVALLGERKIEDLPKPYACIAADIWNGEEIVLDSGSLIKAIRASISVPFLFNPFVLDGRHLVDGGMVNPLPVDQARAMGADFVIAVATTPSTNRQTRFLDTGKTLTRHKIVAAANASTFFRRLLSYFDEQGVVKKVLQKPTSKLPKTPGMRKQMVQMGVTMENMIMKLRLKESPPDILISPQVDDFQFFDFARADEIVSRGVTAAETGLAQLLKSEELHV